MPPGVAVEGMGLDGSVTVRVVEGEFVGVAETIVGVREAEVWVGVSTPLQAAMARTSNSMNLFIYLLSFISVASTSTISPDVSCKLLSSACMCS